ncbi:MAG TPA: glycosyl hydrolase family 65 protein [Pseudonocardiaceae bacterium]
MLREIRLDERTLPIAEALFALSNGHIGWRANLDEGEPHGVPGTYLNGVYEERPLPHAEAAYGYPESSETVVNVTNGKVIRLLVDDEPLDVRYGELAAHQRVLDFRSGVLRRQLRWTSPADSTVEVITERIVSLTQRAVAAVRFEVRAVDRPVRIVVQSELVANEALPPQDPDPRAAAALDKPLRAEDDSVHGSTAVLVHRLARSGLRVAAAMDHEVLEPAGVTPRVESSQDLARTSFAVRLAPGERLVMVKYVGYGWSSRRSVPALRDQVDAALTGATATGWDGLLAEQREFLDDFWRTADVVVEGDAELQQAIRFGLFHVLQSGARAERRAIPAKGLTGQGYDGHSFWDGEMFVLPTLTYTSPDAVRHALAWRHDTLPAALGRARQLGLAGAAFPWRTITGAECSGYWPAGTAAFHVNAAVADAVIRYVDVTGDEEFAGTLGLDLLVHTARLWRSLGHHDPGGAFHIDGVTGPDEYSAIADDNVYTNLMARRNLLAAADAAAKFPARAAALGVDEEESAAWRDAARAMTVPYDEELGVHPQSAGFTRHAHWDFTATPPEHYPLMLSYPYFDIYRRQVTKQADLVLAMQHFPAEFTDGQKARNMAYYEAITVRDSSLSASSQAVLAAEVGALQLAHDYLAEAALTDLDDLHENTVNGLHIAPLASSWVALVSGLGGMRHDGDGRLSFRPRLPPRLSRLCFGLRFRGAVLRVDITPSGVTYTARDCTSLTVLHNGSPLDLPAGEDVTAPLGEVPTPPPLRQPAGRAPRPRPGTDRGLD